MLEYVFWIGLTVLVAAALGWLKRWLWGLIYKKKPPGNGRFSFLLFFVVLLHPDVAVEGDCGEGEEHGHQHTQLHTQLFGG